MMVGAAAEMVGAAAETETVGAVAEMVEAAERERNRFFQCCPVHSLHSTCLRRRRSPCQGLRLRHDIGQNQSLH